MNNLSPAAQQVFWAFNKAASGKPDDWHYLPAIAAALRAATDQVVPEEPEPPELPFASVNDPWPPWNANQKVRARFLAIAAELEAD